jgi:single-strand DNA-binding protein
MQNMNQWIGEGNISCDPVLRYTSDDNPVTNFTLYIDSKYRNKNQTNASDVKFIRRTSRVPIVAWAGKAEHITENYSKGDKVRIMGYLRTKEIKLDSGQRIVTFEIVAKSISLILRPNKNLD